MFRHSERPRRTKTFENLIVTVKNLSDAGLIKVTPDLSALYMCLAYEDEDADVDVEQRLRAQVAEFERFIAAKSDDYKAGKYPASSLLERSEHEGEVKFFCYKNSKRGYVEKSKYTFFRMPGISKDQCFFLAHIPDQANSHTERVGVVKAAHNEVLLFSFENKSITTTHLRCIPEHKRAIGITIGGEYNTGHFNIDISLFLPSNAVDDKAVGIFPNDPTSAESRRKEDLALFTKVHSQVFRAMTDR